MHALIIEDEALIRMMIENYLADLGYTSFDHAETETAAIACAASRLPDLVTADYHLTSGHGLNAVRSICQSKPVPVVLIVGDSADVNQNEFAVLSKPFTFEGLHQAILQAKTHR